MGTSVNEKQYVVAVDLGTTTIAVYVLLPKEKRIVAKLGFDNPQIIHGADVITRITYIDNDELCLCRLQEEVVCACERAIDTCCERKEIKIEEITDMYFVGNPTMCHILLACMPTSLAQAPFVHQYSGCVTCPGSALHFVKLDNTKVTVLPGIKEQVGADTLAAMYACMRKGEACELLLDIGTNVEMALHCNGKYYACSAAAGPALEGGEIRQGMIAKAGAVCGVRWDEQSDKMLLEWIGQQDFPNTTDDMEWGEDFAVKPKGICGSGLVDVAAFLCEFGLIEEDGRLLTPKEAKERGVPQALCKRLVTIETERAFVLYIEKEELLALARGNEAQFVRYVAEKEHGVIYLLQSDIRALQLAKAAIYAAVRIMLRAAAKSMGDVEKIYLAGAFGNYIKVESAMRIGMLPACPKEKVLSVQNAAGEGCVAIACSNEALEQAKKIPEKTHHIPLGNSKVFQEYYLEAMTFKPLLP